MAVGNSSKFRLLVCLALSFWLVTACAFGTDEPDNYLDAEKAYLLGQIDLAEKLVRQIEIFYTSPALIAGQVDQPSIIKSGTGLALEIFENRHIFTPEQLSLISGYLARPSAQYSYDSPAGIFKIHYNTSGPEAVPSQDDNLNSIPDYVERIASYGDSAYITYVANFGYYPPPLDNGEGGDDKYDIYLLAISGYGVTFPDAAGDSAWNDYSSYIGIHRNLYGFPPNDDPEGDTIGAQKVTCAHEVYHAVQLAYDVHEDLWWMEAGAVWMEEVVFPEVNDNYNYLWLFYTKPELALTTDTGYHVYGAFIWPAFLQNKYDVSIFRPIWEACRYNDALDAIDSALVSYGADVRQIFPEFALWNYYTGERTVPGLYFPDAADYPPVDIDLSFSTLAHDSITPVNHPEGLAGNYISFNVGNAKGILEIRLDGAVSVQWAATSIIAAGESDTILTDTASGGSHISLYLPYIEDYNSVAVIPAVISPYASGNNYYLSSIVLPYGDANYDRSVNIGDVTYLLNYIFNKGPAPQPRLQSGDANCNGFVNIADAVYLLCHIFHGGPEPCANR